MSAPSPSPSPLGLLPRFASPPSPPDDDPAPATSPPSSPSTGPASPSHSSPSPDRTGPAPSRPAPAAATPTDTSSASKPTPKQTSELVAGVVGLLVVGAAAVISWRAGRQLRRPTDKQVDDFARPLAEILLRHWDAAVINRDLVDGIAAGAVAGNYLADGPLIERRAQVDPGVPHDLGDDQ